MKKEYITVNLAKVLSDREHIGIDVEYDNNFSMDTLEVEVKYLVGQKFETQKFCCKDFSNIDTYGRYLAELNISEFGNHPNALYYITLIIRDSAYNIREDYIVLSDTYFVYDFMRQEILLMSTDKCCKTSDDLIRKYLILYGHAQAMAVGDLCSAEMFFKALLKNFSNCGDNTNCYNTNLPCGNSGITIPVTSSCGCNR